MTQLVFSRYKLEVAHIYIDKKLEGLQNLSNPEIQSILPQKGLKDYKATRQLVSKTSSAEKI